MSEWRKIWTNGLPNEGDLQNQATGWLRKGCSSLGGGTAVPIFLNLGVIWEMSVQAARIADILSHGVVLPLGFATPGPSRPQESDTYLNFSTSTRTYPYKVSLWSAIEVIKNLLALFSTLFLCAILGEVFLRFVVDEVNFLKPDMMAHPVLRHAISPGSGGHDDWGFRNPIVPGNVQIVAIGDSQTYGTSAPASKSWPARLGRLSMMTVYNMAVGGYGPPDYRYLLNT